MGIFDELLSEAERLREEKEAHAEAVAKARREELLRLAAEGDKQKWVHNGPKPMRVGGPIIDNASRGQQRALCQKHKAEIALWVSAGDTFKKISERLTEIEKIKVSDQSVNFFCSDNEILKPEALKNAQAKLTAALEEIKLLIDGGASRGELCNHYGVSGTSLGEFFAQHGLSTRANRRIKKTQFNTLFARRKSYD